MGNGLETQVCVHVCACVCKAGGRETSYQAGTGREVKEAVGFGQGKESLGWQCDPQGPLQAQDLTWKLGTGRGELAPHFWTRQLCGHDTEWPAGLEGDGEKVWLWQRCHTTCGSRDNSRHECHGSGAEEQPRTPPLGVVLAEITDGRVAELPLCQILLTG